MQGTSRQPTDEAFAPELDAWDAWRPVDVARRFAGVDAPWYVAGGWALDLYLGYQRREHDDLEVAVPHDRFRPFASALADYELFVAGDGLVSPLTEQNEATHHQTWVRDRDTGSWRLDVFREPAEGDTWICRRDDQIRMPYRELIQRTDDGIPYARPEVILLFKAKAARPKDEGDFVALLPHLTPTARRWLIEALEMVHPGHVWIDRLRDV